MFFSTYVLTKKGPLAKIWLAAHWDKKLTRNDVKVIDLNQTVVQIVHPVVPIALRTSGELLVGVVRIYALKVRHLLKEAVDAAHSLKVVNVQIVKGKDAAGKDNAMAVTMDIVVGRTAAEQICEADFGSIADLLKKGPNNASAAAADNDRLIGSAWFQVDASQVFEENINMSQTDDEIAKMRADLLAFGELEQRRAESSSASKKSSTLSSIEKARASGAVAQAVDDLDIGMPLPDDALGMLPLPQSDLDGMGGFLDGGLELPNMLFPEGGADAAGVNLRVPKKKILNILDAAETISKEELKKMYDDQSDIVNSETRHGPVDEQEERDRHVLRSAEGNITRMEAVSHIPNAALRAVFEAALRSSVEKAVAEMETFRTSEREGARRSAADIPFVTDDMAAGGMEMPPPADFDYIAEELPQQKDEGRTSGRNKRGRDEDGKSGAFSASTIKTIERIRALLKRTQQATTFDALNKGVRRIDAARTFVDVLQLASHDLVKLQQQAPYAELTITKTSKLDAVVISAAA